MISPMPGRRGIGDCSPMKKIATTFALLTVLTACAGGRPTVDEITAYLNP